jgi:hypothetical protein
MVLQKLLVRGSVLVSVSFPAQEFSPPPAVVRFCRSTPCCDSPLWISLFARSTEPCGLGSRFPPFFLQLVQFFLEVRFSFLQLLHFAAPVVLVFAKRIIAKTAMMEVNPMAAGQ